MAADLTPRDAWDKALKALEGRLQSSPEDLDLMNARAGLLAAAGRTDAARAQYLAVLERDPTHYATLNNFGVLLCDTHFRTAGRTAFEEAVKLHPHQPAARVNLAKQMLEAGELESARRQYEIALSLDPDMLSAHQQLSEVLRETGDLEGMRRHRRLGYAPRPFCETRGVPL